MKVTKIDSHSSFGRSDILELIEYKDLILTLAWRDLRIRYAQTMVGFLWVFIAPLFSLLILHFVFGKVVNVDSGGVPHLLFTMIGLSTWTYFSRLVSESGSSLLNNRSIITKIYFPKLVLPISKAITCLVDYMVSMLIIAVLLIIYSYIPSSNIIFLPLFVVLTILTALTFGIWIAAITIRYRDFKFVVPLILQLGLYASPIAYSTIAVPDSYQAIFFLNPLVSIIEGTRWCITGEGIIGQNLWFSVVAILILFVSGLYYFKKAEQKLADLI